MATPTIISVTLPADLEEFVTARMESGRFQSADEVLLDALRIVEEQERERAVSRDELRDLIEAGFEQARRGEFIDGKSFLTDLRDKYAELAMERERAGQG
jgi:antitoxin ParD1/3/4